MTPLAGYQIAVASTTPQAWANGRLDALRKAGATVRSCALSRDLWAALSEGGADLIVVLIEHGDPAALALYDELRIDSRARGTAAVLVTSELSCAAQRAAIALGSDTPDTVLIDALSDLLLPTRRLYEAQYRERAMREQLTQELSRFEQAAQEWSEREDETRTSVSALCDHAQRLRDDLEHALTLDQASRFASLLHDLEGAGRPTEKPPDTISESARISSAPPSAPPRGQRVLVPLARLARDVLAMFDNVATRKSQALRGSCDDTVNTWGETLKLKQVMTNLIANAIAYTPRGGQIELQVEWFDDAQFAALIARRCARIVVHDSGPGLTPEQCDRIFQRDASSVELQEAHARSGLVVVKELIAQHGGLLRVSTGPLGGAQFEILLPQDRRLRATSGRSLAQSTRAEDSDPSS
jgi:signal transduction histidine kinase